MQKFLSRLFARMMKSWSWILLICGAIAIKWVSLYPTWVEQNYSYGFFPLISRTQRVLLGWIPFSIGDLFYGFLILVIIFRSFKFFRFLFQKKLTRQYFGLAAQQAIFFFLFVYVFFNLLWGLNYNRLGIATQLGLQVGRYSITDLDTLTTLLQSRLHEYVPFVNEDQRDSFNRKNLLFVESSAAFREAEKKFSFLQYKNISLKPSLFSYAGNVLGFQGYYNPFSGEAQVNTTIPRMLEPFVTTHEIAHQLGYAKENEANFVAFLACRQSNSPVLKYSMYFDMYLYATREIGRRDSARVRSFYQKLHPQVKKDLKEYRAFFSKYRNPIEPVIMWAYGHYLKANNQPGGKQTYNEVVAWLIAYHKKFGQAAL